MTQNIVLAALFLMTLTGSRALAIALSANPFCCPCSATIFNEDANGSVDTSNCTGACPAAGAGSQCSESSQGIPQGPLITTCWCVKPFIGPVLCCYKKVVEQPGQPNVFSCKSECKLQFCPPGCRCEGQQDPDGIGGWDFICFCDAAP